MYHSAVNTISKRICQEGHANALALNRDCTQIAVAGRSLLKVYSIEQDDFIEVCNMRGGKNQNLSYSSNDVAWSTIDHNILATAATNGTISLWDLSRSSRHKQLHVYNEHERTAHTVTFHAIEPHLLVSGSQDGTIKCFDLRCDKAVHTYFTNSESVRDLKFSPQHSNQFAAVSENGTVQLWDMRRPDRSQVQFTAHSGPVYTCDWHPTQPWLATGSRDRQIKVWHMDHKPVLKYNIHTIAVVGRVKWRPDRQFHIASCALVVDYSIYIWDVRRPYIPYASFTEHTNVTTGIAFKGTDPHVLMSASKDSTIFKHSFQDATRPTKLTNPQATCISLNGNIIFAYQVKNSAVVSSECNVQTTSSIGPTLQISSNTTTALSLPIQRAASGSFIPDNNICLYGPINSAQNVSQQQPPHNKQNSLVPPAPAIGKHIFENFHLATSCLLSYTPKSQPSRSNDERESYHLCPYTAVSMKQHWDLNAFSGCAREYIITGADLTDICEYNANVASKYGKTNANILWRFVGNQYELIKSIKKSSTTKNIHYATSVQDEPNVDDTVCNTKEELDKKLTPKYLDVLKMQDLRPRERNSESVNLDYLSTSLSIPTKLLSHNEIAASMISCMYGETDELTVDLVKGLRNGFLYIGPHDLTKGWSLPHNNLIDLHTKSHAHDIEAENRPQHQQEGLFLGKHFKHKRWQPDTVLSDGLQLQVDIGDVQTAVCILIAIGDYRAELLLDDITYEAWLQSYVELLHRHQLWTEATEIINLSWTQSVRELNQQSTAVYTNCGVCSRPITNTGWLCGRCKSARLANCAVCNGPVKSMYAWCQGCSHGGHLEHMRQWFSGHSMCPQCDHLCEHD